MEVVKVNDKNNERVVTIWDLSELKKETLNSVNKDLKNKYNKSKRKNIDYYIINDEEFPVSQDYIQKNIPNKVKLLYLFKSNEYLKLIKCFNELNLSLKNIDEVCKLLEGGRGLCLPVPSIGFEKSFEYVLFEVLEELNIEMKHFYLDNYRLDFYIPKFNLVIEYKDKVRENFIKEKLGNDCKILKLDYRNSDIKNIMEVLKYVYDERI